MAALRRSWSLLPPEILQEIFYKTPAEALVRAKPTCREWYALLTDATFINEHFQRSQERFLRIFFDDTVEIMDPITTTSSVSPVPNELRRHPYKITLVYPLMVHCDGLMLVSYDDDCCCVVSDDGTTTRLPNLALWNPVLKNLRWVEPAQGITSSDYHGIGYDKNGYKILRFNSCPWDVEGCGDAPEVEMYECKTCSWRTLDVKLDMDVHVMYNCVAAMGNMYWIAYREVEEEEFIRSFDFSDESFKDICFCPPSYDSYHLGCFGGDSLSLLQQDHASRNIEVWVSSKLGGGGDGDVSFSKYFSLSGPVLPALWAEVDAASPVYCFVKHRSVIVWCVEVEGGGDKVCTCLTLYEINEDGVRTRIVTKRYNVHDFSRADHCGYVYVPSMIPLPWVRD